MLLKELLHNFASEIERIASQDDMDSHELHFIANALGNLAEAVGSGKFEKAGLRSGGVPDLSPGGIDAEAVRRSHPPPDGSG